MCRPILHLRMHQKRLAAGLRFPRPLADFKGWASGKGKGVEGEEGKEDGHPQFLKRGCAALPNTVLLEIMFVRGMANI